MTYYPKTHLNLVCKEQFDDTCLSKANSSINNSNIGKVCLANKSNQDLYELCLVFSRWFIEMFPCLHTINIWDSSLPANQRHLDNVTMLLNQLSKKYQVSYSELIQIATCNMCFCIDFSGINVNCADYCSKLELFKNNILGSQKGFRKYIDSYFSCGTFR